MQSGDKGRQVGYRQVTTNVYHLLERYDGGIIVE